MIKRKLREYSLLAVLLSSTLGLVACSANELNAGVSIAANLFKGFSITNEQLAAEARQSAQALDRKNKVAATNSRYARRLHKLTRNLTHYDGLNLNYKVYLSKEINAFAMPDGTIRVYSGLMDIMNDDELLAVIGHEIAHVKKQHSLNQYKKAYVAKAMKQGLVAYGGGTASALAGSYGDIGLQFMRAQFSQSDELEADVYGVRFLKSLGRNPYAAADAQRKLLAHSGGGGGFFSTHPPTTKRIKKATEAADKVAKK